ncbi:asparaginase [candidate division KSB3 bacterium]|uniref:Asparaginase n=1 Tax=candidate division KSB3 bacterium TaxID=2044937 RepID=A0A9D5K0C5_9BACT|nr:asparaginase [candidate division KSB3 bacterium]MBD3327654.1 asparaginase [candidate division KSB3 bacterium]
MKHIIKILVTGGTIDMVRSPENGAVVTSPQVTAMLENLPQFRKLEIEVEQFSNIPSPHVSPQIMVDLALKIEQELARQEVQGVVVTHGTDVLEETAYLVDLIIENPKPIVFTGSMRTNTELGADGARNIYASILTAASESACRQGTLVVMNDDIYAARDVTKVHSAHVDAFDSLEFGPLGTIHDEEVRFYRKTPSLEHIPVRSVNANVALIKCVAGMDGSLIRFCLDQGVAGLVLEGFGVGDITPWALESIKEGIRREIPIVLASRCPMGGVRSIYAYEGGSKQLETLGVILAGLLNGQKARIKLMVALEYIQDIDQIRTLFSESKL